MSRWVIYDKSGGVRAVSDGLGTAGEWTLPELEYSGEWMGETFVTLNVRCAVPIEFEIGDYVVYRGEKFVMNYDPTVVKKARRGSYGEGFVYDNVKFNSLGYELTVARMLDYVLYDNEVHYSSLPKFSFFCTDVEDLADRLQVNMNRYCADNGFAVADYWLFLTPSRDATVLRAQSYGLSAEEAGKRWAAASFSIVGAKVNQNVSIDNMSVWDSLKFIKDTFGLNFVVRGRSVVVGSAGLPTEDIFEYGKDKGLYEIERTADSEQQIVTKLFSYGSGKNLPVRYYANLNAEYFMTVADIEYNGNDGTNDNYLLALDGEADERSMFKVKQSISGSSGFLAATSVQVDGVGSAISVNVAYDTNRAVHFSVPCSYFQNTLSRGTKLYFTSNIDGDKWPAANKEYSGDASALPNNMAVQVLMLPGFPSQSLYDWVLAHGGTAVGDTHNTNEFARARWTDDEGEVYDAFFSKVALKPFVISPNFIALGIREATKYFDGSDGEDEVFPTIEGIPGKNIVLHSDVIEDNGVFGEDVESIANFNIYLPDFGSDFDLAALLQGDTAIEMKSGYCGGRAFKVHSVERVGSGVNMRWKCNCERELDSDLSIYFPYSHNASIGQTPIANEAYQVRGSDIQDYEGDRYVLTGIEMTSTYVDAASIRLLKYTLRFLAKNDYTRYTFVPKVDEIFMARQHDLAVASRETEQVVKSYYETLKEGDILLFRDTDLGISYETSGSDASVFIDTLRIKEYGNGQIPTYDVTLRDDKQVGTIQRLQEKVSSLSSSLSGGGAGGTNIPQVQSLIKTYGKELFLSKVSDDTASGVISFLKGALFGDNGAFGWVKSAATWMGQSFTNGVAWFRNLLADLGVFGKVRGAQSVDDDTFLEVDGAIGGRYDGSGAVSWLIGDDGIAKLAGAVADYIVSRGYGGDDIVGGSGWKLEKDAQGRGHLYTDFLTVRLKAIFASLEIRKVTYTAGTLTVSGAGSEAYRVVRIGKDGNKIPDDSTADVYAYRVYCVADDGTTATMNFWHEGDQAKCQTFNIKEGTYQNVSNRYWWRLVLRKGSETLEDGKIYDYIDVASSVRFSIPGALSKSEYPIYADLFDEWERLHPNGKLSEHTFFAYDNLSAQPSNPETGELVMQCDLPAVGDTMAQQGSQVDEDRMGFAVVMAKGIESGFYIYTGVNSYSLAGKQTTKVTPKEVILSSRYFKIVSDADTGNPKPVTIYRGQWYQGANSTLYDAWSHNGSMWLCLANGIITTEPRDGDANWEKMVEKGADGESGVGLGENLIDHSEAASTFNVSELNEDTLGNDYVRYGLTDKTYVVANLPADGTIASGRVRVTLSNCTFKANKNNSNTDERGRYGLVQVYIEAKNGSQGTAWPEICQAKVYEDGVLELNHEGFALDANGGTFDGKVWLSLRNFASGTVSVERVKLEVGEKCSAWSLSENDKKGEDGQKGDKGDDGADGNAFTLSPSEFVVTQRYGENVSGWDVANNSVVASGFYRSGNNASEAAAMAIQSVAPSTAAGVLKVSQTQTNKLLIDTTALGNIDNGINYITATIRLSKGSLYQDLTFNLYINRLGTLYSQTISDATETIRQRSGWKYNPTTREWEELALVSYVEESAEGFSRQISSLPIQKNLLLNTEFSALSGGGIRAMHVTSVGGNLWLQYTESRKMLPHNNYFMLSFFGRGSGSLVCSYEVYKEGRTSAVRSGSTTLTLSSSTQRQYVKFNTNITTAAQIDEEGYTFVIKFSTTGGGEFYLSRPQLEAIGSATRPTTWSNGSPNILLNSAFSEIENDAPKYWEYKGSPSARELSIEVPPYWNDWMLWDTTTCPDVLSVVDGVLRLNPTAQYQGITQYSNVGSAGRWEKVLKHGGTYTVSFKAKGADSTNMASFILHVLKIGDDGQPIAVPAGQGRSQIGADFPIEETWKSYSFTFTISPTGIWNLTEEQTDLAGYGFFFMIGCAHGTQVSSEVLDIKEVQLEAGSLATSWQPASYDAVYRATQIQQTADEILLTVKKGEEVGGLLITEQGTRLKGALTTIEGDLDLQGLTTENVKKIERNAYIPTVINMGIGVSGENVIKSVQVIGDAAALQSTDVASTIVVLPFYDSDNSKWSSFFSNINMNDDETFNLYSGKKVVQWTKAGTRLSVTNSVVYKYRNWQNINNDINANKLDGFVVVCSDGRVICRENLSSGMYNPSTDANGQLSSNPQLHAGLFSCGGYLSRFIILLPGQSLQLRSEIVSVSNNREVLVWVVENPSEFEPYYFDSGGIAQLEFIDNDIMDYKSQEASFNTEDSMQGYAETILAAPVMKHRTNRTIQFQSMYNNV